MTIARLKPILRQLLIILFMVIGVLSCRTLLMYYGANKRCSEEGLQILYRQLIFYILFILSFKGPISLKEHLYIYALLN